MKGKKFLFLLVMLSSALFAKADLQPVNGWYEISNFDELQEFIMLLRNGQTSICGKLTADIDMTGVTNFMPLAYKQEDAVDCGYTGQFDGQCHVVRNMNLELAEDQTHHLGFFGHINGGTVVNLGFENARLVSTWGAPVGVLAAWAENANISNCYVAGELENQLIVVRNAAEYDYAFDVLGAESIFAESLIKNTRSQHIMEKMGFKYFGEEDGFKQYRLEKKDRVK